MVNNVTVGISRKRKKDTSNKKTITLTEKEIDFLANVIESENIKLDSLEQEAKNKTVIKEIDEVVSSIKKKLPKPSANAYLW